MWAAQSRWSTIPARSRSRLRHRTRRAQHRDVLEQACDRIDAVEQQVQGWCVIEREAAWAQAELLDDEAARRHDTRTAARHSRRRQGCDRRRGPAHPRGQRDARARAGQPRSTHRWSHSCARPAPSCSARRTPPSSPISTGRRRRAIRGTWRIRRADRAPGPAAVVAAGMVPLSLGTQTAGSVSRPAAYCGIAAFKPSTRAWSSFGVVPFSPSFDTVGVFGYRVADAAAAARVLMPPYIAPPCSAGHRNQIGSDRRSNPAERQRRGRAIDRRPQPRKLREPASTYNDADRHSRSATSFAWHKTVTRIRAGARAPGNCAGPSAT